MCNRLRIALLLMLIVFASGCAARKDMVILVPDPEGRTGSITVTNQAGTVAIETPNHATTISNSNVIPAPPERIEKAEIDKQFSEALSIQPKQSRHFILYFEKDTQLTAESGKLIPDILQSVRERNSVDISVVGHADTVGSRDFNMALSRKRAESVRALLVDQGVETSNITTTSHGKENPLIKTEDNVNEPRNRRVEVIVR